MVWMPYQFGETTTWSEPCIIDWETDSQDIAFNHEHPYSQATVEFKVIDREGREIHCGLTDFPVATIWQLCGIGQPGHGFD